MLAVLLLVFFAVFTVDLFAIGSVIFRADVKRKVKVRYWAGICLAIAATVVMTGFFSYYSNPNTHIFRWPIPHVVFQRDTPTSPWLDYVGPTVLLAWPMNFVLYSFIPSVALLIAARKAARKSHP